MHSIRSITLTVACSVAGLLSFSDQAKADPYYWGAGYGYSSYYAPYSGGYYAGYTPYWSGYNSYWSGYSPAWSSSYYWPSYTYASYAPAYAYGYGNNCCAPSCCDACGSGNCGPGGCNAAPPANAPKTPRPDNGPPPSTYEGDKNPADGFKPRTDGGAAPAPNGSPEPADDGDAEKRDAFKQIETKKPVTEEPQIIPQKAPMKDPAEGTTPAPNTILGPKSTTPTPAPTNPPAPATNAPPADQKAAPEKKEDTKVEVEDLKAPTSTTSEDVHPPELKLDSKMTWKNSPSHTRLAMRSVVGSTKNVRTSPIPSNRNWVPVDKATVIVRK